MKNEQSILDMTRDQWLEARRSGIGGSDAGAILGKNKWRTPLDVYQDKIGSAPATEENEAMYWGRNLEDLVAKEYEIRTGNKIRRNNRIVKHPEHDFIIANLDREIVGKDGILEVKTSRVASDWGDPTTTEIPASYLAQVQHYMAVTGADFADVAVLISGSDFRIYHIPRHEELIAAMIEAEVKFWIENVLAGVQPDPISATDMKTLWPVDNGETLVTTNGTTKTVAQLKDVKQQIKDLKADEKDLTIEIQKVMANNSILEDGDGHTLATWKERKSCRFNTKRLKDEAMDIYEKFLVETSGRFFILK